MFVFGPRLRIMTLHVRKSQFRMKETFLVKICGHFRTLTIPIADMIHVLESFRKETFPVKVSRFQSRLHMTIPIANMTHVLESLYS